MSTKHWFGRKRYGWGWTPITWQGWLSLAVFIAIFTFGATAFVNAGTSPRHWFALAIWSASVIFCFLLFVRSKGPAARWQWGDRAGS